MCTCTARLQLDTGHVPSFAVILNRLKPVSKRGFDNT